MLRVGSVRKGTERIEWGLDETKYKQSHWGFSTLKSAGGIDGELGYRLFFRNTA